MPSVPTPAAARYISAGEPRPPAPTREHLGVLQPLLPGHRDVRDDQVARVAPDLLGRQLGSWLDQRGQRHCFSPQVTTDNSSGSSTVVTARIISPRSTACHAWETLPNPRLFRRPTGHNQGHGNLGQVEKQGRSRQGRRQAEGRQGARQRADAGRRQGRSAKGNLKQAGEKVKDAL